MTQLTKYLLLSSMILCNYAFAASSGGYSTKESNNPTNHQPSSSYTTQTSTPSDQATVSHRGYSTQEGATGQQSNPSTQNRTYHTSTSTQTPVSRKGYSTQSGGAGQANSVTTQNRTYHTTTQGPVSRKGYSTVGSNQVSNHGYQTRASFNGPVRQYYSEPREDYRFTISTTTFAPTYYDDDYFVVSHHEPRWPRWYRAEYGGPIPADAVVGGHHRASGAPFFICRTDYQGAIFPGRLTGGKCHFTTKGTEIAATQYQVLVSPYPMRWIGASFGHIPRQAIYGGNGRDGHALFICQATYQGHRVPGKIAARTCKIALNGQEIAVPYYNVLVRA